MKHVRNAWYVAAWSSDLAVGKLTSMSIANDPIVLYRRMDGAAVVMEDRCVHRFAPLSAGRPEFDTLTPFCAVSGSAAHMNQYLRDTFPASRVV